MVQMLSWKSHLISRDNKDLTRYGFARKRLLMGPGKDFNAVNHVIEAMLLPESEGKGLYVADLRALTSE